MTPFIILIHIIAAAVWTGGHLVLAIRFLPKALKNQDPAIIDFFESSFERIGIPAFFPGDHRVLSGPLLCLGCFAMAESGSAYRQNFYS